jgi:hypothetical protein
MTFCKECGVELEDHMQNCPLCGTSVLSGSKEPRSDNSKQRNAPDVKKKHLLSQVLLQITSILLLSGIAATLFINVAMEGKITWSVYPTSICLIILCYVALIFLWHTQTAFQLFGSWILAVVVLLILNALIDENWPLMLALPILCAANIIVLILTFVLRALKTKGLNIFAIVVLAIAILCLIIEGIISFYFEHAINLGWSVIVSACLLPVIAAILFMYFRTRNNSDLKKIFHT